MKKVEYMDISFPYYEGMAIYPNNPEYVYRKLSDMQNGDLCNISEIIFGTHTGTHIDAPAHFIQGGATIDQLSLDQINGKAKVLHIEEPIITVSCLERYIIEKDDILIFQTNNSKRFEGKNILDSYVTLDYDAAQLLVDKEIKMVGIDYMTIERPRALREQGKCIHEIILGKGIPILEALDLRGIEEGEYLLFCAPLKIVGSDGCPVRVLLV